MPVLLWIGSFLVSILSSAISFFLQYASKRLAITLAVVAGIGTLTFSFFAGIYALTSALVTITPGPVVQACSLLIPDNFVGLVTACAGARLLRWAYEWNVKVIQMRLN